MKIRIIFLLALSLLLSTALFAQINENAGTAAAPFLRMGIGARAEGMGGAFVSLADDLNAIYWNPAGLAKLERGEIDMTYIHWFEGIRNHSVSFAYPIKKLKGTVGVNVLYLSVTGLDKMNDDGLRIGSLSNFNGSVTTSYAFEVSPLLCLGGSLKVVNQKYDKYSGYSMALDAGALWQPVDKVSMGFCLKNMGPKMDVGGGEGSSPFVFKAGLAVWPLEQDLRIAMELDKPVDSELKTYLGAEFWVRDKVAFRAGYKYLSPREKDNALCAGIGFKAPFSPPKEKAWFEEETSAVIKPPVGEKKNELILDYAISSHGIFGLIHYFSLGLTF